MKREKEKREKLLLVLSEEEIVFATSLLFWEMPLKSRENDRFSQQLGRIVNR